MNRAQKILEGEPNIALRGGSSGTVAPTLTGENAGLIQPTGINVPNIFIPA